MKYKFSLSRKKIWISTLCLIGVLALLIGTFSANSNTVRFHKAAKQLFEEEMLANTLNMHYTLAYPEEFGLTEYTVILPAYQKSEQQKSQSLLQEQLTFFQSLNSEKLSTEDAYTLSLLISYLENTLTLNEFSYYNEPLSPSSGTQSQLPILLAEYPFRCRKDVENYLKILDQTDSYFDGLLAYEQEKSAAGLFMAASSIDQVIEQCDTILTKDSLEAGTHFLQTTFTERLEALKSEGILSEKEVIAYQHQNNRLLSTVLLPAYRALGDGLLVLKDDTIPLSGLASKPFGKEYYRHLLISETGSYRSILELKELFVNQLAKEYDILSLLLSQYTEPVFSNIQTSVTDNFPYDNAADMLKNLTQTMALDFPSFHNGKDNIPTVRIKNVSKSLEEYCAPAFYLTPPMDDTISNVIYINQKNSPAGVDLYTTLAHEGYPGHMYQSVYSNNLLAEQDTGYLRQLLWYGGYLEGWALYVEFLSFDNASSLMEECGFSPQAEYIQIEKHNRSLQLCLYSLLDIMIHYENAGYSEVHKTLSNFGITSPDTTARIYEYIVEEPANYPKYYLGYLEILALQEDARKLWGADYSNYAFHEFFLKNGPADFPHLKSCLQ